MNGFVHILRSISENTRDKYTYSVIFAPIGPTGTGGSVPARNVNEESDLVRLLRVYMHIHQGVIHRVLEDLKIDGSASIPNVNLSEDQLDSLGLTPTLR